MTLLETDRIPCPGGGLARLRWLPIALCALALSSACSNDANDTVEPGAADAAAPDRSDGSGSEPARQADGGGLGDGGELVPGSAGDAGSGLTDAGSNATPATDASAPIPSPVITPTPPDAELATASGCPGIFNPDQLLTLALDVDPSDWNQVLSDSTYSVVVPAQMHCEDEPPLTVGVRRKRSGGQQKVGLKIDMNAIVPGQAWYGLKKLSLENGVSEGDTADGAEVQAYVAEYLAWRLMVLSGAISSRVAFVALQVNGESLGVYVSVEQVDKRFLQARLGDDSGWLYKKSGGVNDGLKTNELNAQGNPYDDYFCFWASGNSCPAPSSAELAAELPVHLDIPQFLRFGAVNALIANTDGPLFKENNYYYYDYATGPRAYIPWDLDTAMKDHPSVYTGGGGGGGMNSFHGVLFTHWQDDYTEILRELIDAQLTQSVIEAELDRVLLVAGEALDADAFVTGTAGEAVTALKQYWTQRLAEVSAELQ